ncbi:MAG: molybdate ABC transporter substrate-binding protein [Burkholderiales bacterium]
MNRHFLSRRVHLMVFAGFLLACAAGSGARAQEEVSIAAASDLTFCLEELHRKFSGIQPRTRIVVSNGSSGTFFAQIRHGAPFDLFLSADAQYPRRLIEEKLADPDSLFQYAIGRIVLWTMRTDLEVEAGLGLVTDPKVKHVAIANPSHAPYGRAAKAALERSGWWDAAQPKLVMGENISQARQYVQTANADLGIIALSLVTAPSLAGVGRYYLIPETLHPPIEQSAVLTLRGARNPAARSFLAFLKTPAARVIFERYGFRRPE